MDELSNTVTTIILTVIGGLVSLLAWVIKTFMSKTEQKIDEYDKRLDTIETDLGIITTKQTLNEEKLTGILTRIETQLDKIDARFMEYDKNIAEFWKNNGNKLN
jgi:uncharacterized protein YoxC